MANNKRGPAVLSPIQIDGTVYTENDEMGLKDPWYQQLKHLSTIIIVTTPVVTGIEAILYFLIERENIETFALYSGVLSLVFLLLCLCTFERRLIKQRCNYVKSCSLVWVIVLALSFDSYFKLGLFF